MEEEADQVAARHAVGIFEGGHDAGDGVRLEQQRGATIDSIGAGSVEGGECRRLCARDLIGSSASPAMAASRITCTSSVTIGSRRSGSIRWDWRGAAASRSAELKEIRRLVEENQASLRRSWDDYFES
jgi:hypothetical protein